MAFGDLVRTLKNTYPIVLGVILASLLFKKELTEGGAVLALLFSDIGTFSGSIRVSYQYSGRSFTFIVVEITAHWQGCLKSL